MSTYTILAAPIESTTEEKNSEFLTFLHPVASREEAMAQVDVYRKQYPDAAHVCWAYVIGNTRQLQTQAFSDDGEPSGTAGKPILRVPFRLPDFLRSTGSSIRFQGLAGWYFFVFFVGLFIKHGCCSLGLSCVRVWPFHLIFTNIAHQQP